MEFTTMRAPSVFAELGAANLLFHGVDIFVVEQFAGDPGPEIQHLGKRSSRRSENLEDEMAFAKLRQELTAEIAQPGGGKNAKNDHQSNHDARPASDKPQDASITRFEPT